MTSLAEIAWASGLFDGEGSVTVSGRHRRMAVAMTDEAIVRRFHAAVGVGTVSPPRYRKDYKPLFVWYAQAANAVVVCDLLLPYVSERNRLRFEALKQAFWEDKNAVCERCGKAFTRKSRRGRFCTRLCAARQRVDDQAETVPCEKCGSPFERRYAERRFCDTCGALERRRDETVALQPRLEDGRFVHTA